MIEKTCTLSVMDRLFIAVNVDIEGGPGDEETNPDRALCRYEFLEILLRIAIAKYKDTGICKFFSESLEKLLSEILFGSTMVIEDFRKKEVYTLPIDDLLRTNIAGVRKVFDRYAGNRRFLTMRDVAQMLKKDCQLDLLDQDIARSYGYSKMTIVQELEYVSLYNQLSFDEFLEFLVRISSIAFKEKENEKKTLCEKLDMLLIKLLAIVRSIKYPPYIPDESSSEDES